VPDYLAKAVRTLLSFCTKNEAPGTWQGGCAHWPEKKSRKYATFSERFLFEIIPA